MNALTVPSPRPRARGRAIPGVLLGLSLLIGGCSSTWGPKFSETRTLQVPHVASSALDISSHNGKVEVLATERPDVSIEVTLRSNSEQRLADTRVIASRDDDSTLHVDVEWPGGRRQSNEGASISLNVPGAHDVHVRSSNGSITIAGLSGHADLKSSNGTVRVDTHDGSVYASTSNGRLIALNVSGEIEMHSSNGSINVEDAFGPVLVETSNGNVQLSTMPGNVGPVRVRSSNGSVTLNLGEGIEGVFRCDTSNGKITVSDLPDATLIESSRNSVKLRLGEGDEVSAVRTSNGSVRVQGR